MLEVKIDNHEGGDVKLWVTANPDEARHHGFRWSEYTQMWVKPMKDGELPDDCDGDFPVLIEGGVYKLAVSPDYGKSARYFVANVGLAPHYWMLSDGDDWITEANGKWGVDPSGILYDDDGCKSGFTWRDLKFTGAIVLSVATPERLSPEKLARFSCRVADLMDQIVREP